MESFGALDQLQLAGNGRDKIIFFVA